MVIDYEPEDLTTEDQSVLDNMEMFAKQANKAFMEYVYGPDSIKRQNFDRIPQVKVTNRFISEFNKVTEQKLVFTIQTEYRHEVYFDEMVDGKYGDGTYFMPPHYKV
jgi:hypothetical protein